MYRDGQVLDNVFSWEDAIVMFFNWLRDEYPNGAILVAHAAFNTDARLIIRDFQQRGWDDDEIESTVVGFCDTLVAFPNYFPKCENRGKYFILENLNTVFIHINLNTVPLLLLQKCSFTTLLKCGNES